MDRLGIPPEEYGGAEVPICPPEPVHERAFHAPSIVPQRIGRYTRHMLLSAFPQLLFLAPLAIALLRIVAGLFVLYVAWQIAERRTALSHEKYPVIGKAPEWMLLPAALAYAVAGGLLLIGAWTQIAALISALGMLKLSILSRMRAHESLAILPESTYLLLLAISVALVVTGAGAFAFDLPL